MIVLRPNEVLPVKIGELTFLLAPLSYGQRMRVISAMTQRQGEISEVGANSAALALRLSLKGVRGANYSDGTPFEIQFNENGEATDESIDAVFQLGQASQLILVAQNWLAGSLGGVEIPGVEFDFSKVEALKKK